MSTATDRSTLPFPATPVSPDYSDRRPFRFPGTIDYVDVEVFPPDMGG